MMEKLFSSSAIVTRSDVSSFTKVLLLMFISGVLFWLIGSIICHYQMKRHKRKKKVLNKWRKTSMTIGIISTINLFYLGGALFIMLTLLATIEVNVLLKEYLLFILLVAIFSNLLSFIGLWLISKSYLKKRKRKGKSYQEFLVSLSVVTILSDFFIIGIFPLSFRGIAVILVVTSLFQFLIGFLIVSLTLKKQTNQNKQKIKRD